MKGKPIFAALFFLGIAYVLALPLLDAEDGEPRSARVESTPTPEAEPPKSPEPEDTPDPEDSPSPEEPEGPPDTAQLAGNYPQECLQREGGPGDDGLLAIDQEQGLEISDPDGGNQVTVDDKFPFKWSPSGSFLTGGSGAIYDLDGNEVGQPFSGQGSFSWAWSPISDCMVVSSPEETSVVVPGDDPVELHDEPLARFAFSPSGGDLAYTQIADGSAHVWVASLADGEARRLKTLPLAEDKDLVLAGWTPNGSHVLFWRGRTDALLKEGVPLYAVSADREVSKFPPVLAHRDFLAPCGDDLLAVIGEGARTNPNSKRVARIDPGTEPEFITPEGVRDESPSCSPNAEFIAVARSEGVNGTGPSRLTILDGDGTVSFQPSDTGYQDSYPLWGRGEAGVLFIRKQQGEDHSVWHVTTDTPAEATGATLRAVGRDAGIFRDSWGHFIDWSADLPSGVSVISEL